MDFVPSTFVCPPSSAKYHFITFGGNTQRYHNAVMRICKQAPLLRIFDTIKGYTEKYLQQDTDFWKKHHHFIENNPRGYGYWIWKSYIVKKRLEEIDDNDVIVYVDAGCELNVNGSSRMYEYIQKTNETDTGIVGFQMPGLNEKTWTKMDVLTRLNATEFADTPQIFSTAIIIRKCAKSVEIMNEWYKTCSEYSMITDAPSTVPNHPSFRDHRHDQSVLSILLKKHKCQLFNDETYFYDEINKVHKWFTHGIRYPIWTLRNRNSDLSKSIVYK
jgi:hypothetical protein